MHRYEFLSNEQNLIRPYEIDRFQTVIKIGSKLCHVK